MNAVGIAAATYAYRIFWISAGLVAVLHLGGC